MTPSWREASRLGMESQASLSPGRPRCLFLGPVEHQSRTPAHPLCLGKLLRTVVECGWRSNPKLQSMEANQESPARESEESAGPVRVTDASRSNLSKLCGNEHSVCVDGHSWSVWIGRSPRFRTAEAWITIRGRYFVPLGYTRILLASPVFNRSIAFGKSFIAMRSVITGCRSSLPALSSAVI